MSKKQFKTESKKLMDLMINSIYTNKEIFLREIISNASDAIDKLHYRSLTDSTMKIDKKKFEIRISIDKDHRILTISDNGCGMTQEELENNLGTIAKSGSLAFKNENEHKKNIDIIGQFGVGFYSAFMVSSKVQVISRAYGSDTATLWESEGVDGYTIQPAERDTYGTDVILTIKEDNDDENYSDYLSEYHIKHLITKYSDYITYPIKMECEKRVPKKGKEGEYETKTEIETINSLIPLWKKNKNKITEEEYNTFYSDKFFDYEKPLKTIHFNLEGTMEFTALLYIPKVAPMNYYTKEYEKGLQLYSNGVLIMEKCSDLLPDYFSFVKGVIDSSDVPLNISRETLQQNKIVRLIAKNVETKIIKALEEMMKENPEDYKTFFKAFGNQLKFGIYNSYGMEKEKLQDFLLYETSEGRSVTFKEYVDSMKEDQKEIYYACGDTTSKIRLLPQVESVCDKGYEVLYLTDYVDEFVLQVLGSYQDKKFVNVCSSNLDLTTKEEKEELEKKNKDSKDLFKVMKEALPDIQDIRFTNKLKNHPVCLQSEGEVSVEMEKVINAMPTDEKIKASLILEINEHHEIVSKLEELYKKDKEALKEYSKILYAQARLIEGLPLDNPAEISNLIISNLAKEK